MTLEKPPIDSVVSPNSVNSPPCSISPEATPELEDKPEIKPSVQRLAVTAMSQFTIYFVDHHPSENGSPATNIQADTSPPQHLLNSVEKPSEDPNCVGWSNGVTGKVPASDVDEVDSRQESTEL